MGKILPTEKPKVPKRDQIKGFAGCLSLLVAFFFIFSFFSSCGSSKKEPSPIQEKPATSTSQVSPEELKKQQAEFLAWNSQVQSDIEAFDSTWSEWKKTFDGLSNGSINHQEALAKFKAISSKMDALSTKFYKYSPPTSLSKEDKDILEGATCLLANMSTSRKIAADKAIKMINEQDYTPKKTSDILLSIKNSDEDMLHGIVAIKQIKSKLSLDAK